MDDTTSDLEGLPAFIVYRNETSQTDTPVFTLGLQSTAANDDLRDALGLTASALRPVEKRRSSTLAGDFDGDGDADLVVTGQGATGPTASLYVNDGPGTFSLSDQSSGETSETFLPLEDGSRLVFDIDLHGDLDIPTMGRTDLAGGYDVRAARAYVNDGEGVFQRSSLGILALDDDTFAAADFDADGDLDIVQLGEQTYGTYRSAAYINHTIR